MAELGEGHRYHLADLSNQQGIASCTKLIDENRINLLVNNAGFSQFGVFRDGDVEQQVDILTVNCAEIYTYRTAVAGTFPHQFQLI